MDFSMGINIIIAIDGPASSGKSTTAKQLAKLLKYIYIDTGAMYRACALCSLKSGIEISDHEKLKKMIEEISISFEYNENGNQVFLNEENVSKRIREEDISRLSSEIAVIGFVRERMVALQQKMGQNCSVIMDGRDIGTVVFPDADYKFYMDASVEKRAERRFIELQDRNVETDYNSVLEEMKWRDHNDMNREISPLRKADDAIVVKTDNMTIDEQVSYIYSVVKNEK